MAQVSEASEFFLDGTYRERPDDYRPDTQVFTLTVAPAAGPT